jgi:dolichol kinase
MDKLLLALTPIAVVLLLSEYLWHKKLLKGERARKFIHIIAGVWMAFWPFYLPFDGIFILGFMAVTVLIYSRFTGLFHAIYAVKRKTYGEIFFALAIVLCAYFGQENWVFTISILLLAIADGGAAVAGRLWGATNSYALFGNENLRKSIAGTIAFLILAYVAVVIGYFVGGEEVLSDNLFIAFLVLPISATIIENSMPYGLDNFFTPLFATVLLNSLL